MREPSKLNLVGRLNRRRDRREFFAVFAFRLSLVNTGLLLAILWRVS